MKLIHLDLDQLKPAKVNVRKRGGKEIADLVPSIRSLGLLQPLLVRPNCEGYEVVAGQRRYNALRKLAEEATPDPVPCIVMKEGDDAKAIEASLAENVARLPMDEIDQYKAFAALAKQGTTVDDIAAQFGVTPRLVKQRLAVANIIDPILNAFRREEIGADTLRTLTMATKRQQKAWWDLFKDEEAYAPQGRALRTWLFGGADIPVENALFDVAEYDGSIISDLFSETRYFDDAEKFLALQNAAIAKLKADYEVDGWQEVIVLDFGDRWSQWEHKNVDKDDGGRVYIQTSHDGEVTVHEGWLTDKDAARLEKAKAKVEALANGEEVPSSDKPELTKAMQTYLDLHRHAAVRHDLLIASGIALRLATAQIIAGSDLWDVSPEPQKAGREDIAESLSANKAELAFAEERAAIRALLGIDGEQQDAIVSKTPYWPSHNNLLDLFFRLTHLDDDTVTRIFTFVIAETLPCGSELVEALGIIFETDLSKYWSPDDTFFDLLKDKQAINAVLKEVGGKAVADVHIASTAKVQKGVIRQHIDGTRKPHKPDWIPGYAAFPMKGYTKRGGVEAIERGKAARKLLNAA